MCVPRLLFFSLFCFYLHFSCSTTCLSYCTITYALTHTDIHIVLLRCKRRIGTCCAKNIACTKHSCGTAQPASSVIMQELSTLPNHMVTLCHSNYTQDGTISRDYWQSSISKCMRNTQPVPALTVPLACFGSKLQPGNSMTMVQDHLDDF